MRRRGLLADIWNHEFHDTAVKDVVVGIGELQQHPMRAGRQILNDDGNTARVGPVPGQTINTDMEVSDTRRNRERRLAKYGHDPDVLGPVLDNDDAPGQRRCQWWIDGEPGGWLRFRERDDTW